MTEDELRAQIGIPSKFSPTDGRGLPYYGQLKTLYPHHWSSFHCMHGRSTPIAECFSRSVDGFIAFIFYLGDVPEGMVRPTLGRIDHNRGYEPGNFAWQEDVENKREVMLRKPTGHSSRVQKDRNAEIRKTRPDVVAKWDAGLRKKNALGRHTRWHTNRGIKKIGCPFCEEE